MVYSPKISEEKQKQEIKNLDNLVAKTDGKIVMKEIWGKRQFAFLVAKQAEGFYVHWKLILPPAGPAKFDKELRVNDIIMRHLLVKVEKSAEKVAEKKAEEKKVAKKSESKVKKVAKKPVAKKSTKK